MTRRHPLGLPVLSCPGMWKRFSCGSVTGPTYLVPLAGGLPFLPARPVGYWSQGWV